MLIVVERVGVRESAEAIANWLKLRGFILFRDLFASAHSAPY